MKKSMSRRLPRKLILRGEAIAALTADQLGQIAGASQLSACSVHSNLQVSFCATTDTGDGG